LKEYLENSAQDFINFKVSLLMKEAKSDPVKKAGLIRDIVTSISKIPDGIQREVYVQECARIMDISERVLFSELAQMLNMETKPKSSQRKANVDPNEPPPEYFQEQDQQASMSLVKGGEVSFEKVDQLDILEKEVIRILLLYGNEQVDFVQYVEVENEEGKVSLEKDEYTNQVSQELYVNLQDDEIEFTNEVFKMVYYELIHQINQEEKIEVEHLVNHENKVVAGEVTNILMDEEKYELSNWESKDIYVTDIKKILPKLVSDAILNLRRVLIEKKINEIMQEAISQNSTSVDLELITNYTGLKKRLFEKLNRVV
jgi:DNA primase